MRFKKAYVEITNVCNLSCKFCPKTHRAPRYMSLDEFRIAANKLRGVSEYIYLHVMGEPTLHHDLRKIVEYAHSIGFKVSITTNGTNLDVLSSLPLYKISISLHSREANDLFSTDYLNRVFSFVKDASETTICALRLWNLNSKLATHNDEIIALIKQSFPLFEEGRSIKLLNNVYLENESIFEWPDINADCEGHGFCMGLRDQIAVLCDGTVVPCCLDSDGNIPLGNIFKDNIEDIVSSDVASNIYNGFSNRKAVMPLCLKCNYKKRFD